VGSGDILVFLPGEREIRDTAEALRKHHPPGTEILPLFSRLSVAEQDAIFKPTNALRRIVLATNVAETSLTVPGIRYVIDPGTARVKRYSARNKVEQLLIEKVSQASANQRAGRCGRVADGVCIRLYDEADFGNRPRFTDPELLRSSLAGVILRMKSLGLGDVVGFPFIDPPSSRLVTDGYQLLAELHALDEAGQLTKIGTKLAKLPLDPRIARMLLAAEQQRCVREVLIIASALSVQDPRDRPMERAQAADEKHKLFADERSDFMGWLKLWRWYEEQVQHKKTNRQLQTLLQDHFLSPRRMREWRDIHGQLHAQMSELGLKENEKDAGYDTIHQALLTGLLGNIGFKSDDAKGGSAQARRGQLPGRARHQAVDPPRLGAGEKRTEVDHGGRADRHRAAARAHRRRGAAGMDRGGGPSPAHAHVHRAALGAGRRARGRVRAREPVRHHAGAAAQDPLRPDRPGAVARTVHPRRAGGRRIRHEGAVVRPQPRADQGNRGPRTQGAQVGRVAGRGAHLPRVRRAHPGRTSTTARRSRKWRAEAEAANPKILFLQREDILGEGLGADHALFPETMAVDGVACKLKYRFEPGHVLDGVTLHLPLYLLNRIEPAQIDWLVPGLIREKLTLLLKSLPKDKRRPLIPLPDTVTAFLSVAKPGERTLTEALAAFIRKKTGTDIHPDEWKGELPPHLQMNLSVIDDSGQELASGRDLVALRQQLGRRGAHHLRRRRRGQRVRAHRADRMEFRRPAGAGEIQARRARADRLSGAGRQRRECRPAPARCRRRGGGRDPPRRGAAAAHRARRAVQAARQGLSRETALALKFRSFGSAEQLRAALIDAIATRALLGDDDTPRDAKTFGKQKERAKPRIAVVKQALLRDVAEILDLHAQVAARLAAKPQFTAAMRDETAHLAALVPADFITATPWTHLKDLPRYLRGILKRLEKLPASEQRDSRGMAGVLTLQNKYLARRAQVKGEVPAALDDFRWQLEELRISLFAQELKTPYPVSVKRLDKLWDELARQPLN
jgi:ATP-dependent helicase HrpA